MLKSFLSLLAAGAILSNINAESKELIVDQNNPEKWTGKVEFAPDHARNNGPCFVLYGPYPTPLIYNQYIPIDPGKSYTFKVKFRTLDAALPASGYMGFELYDAKKRKITYRNVVSVDLKLSEVISAKKVKKLQVAFNAKEDFSDIPNFDISPAIKNAEKDENGNLRLELVRPLTKDYPAGTTLRFHSPYGAPMYYLASGWMPAGEGKECTAVLNGIFDKSGAPNNKFWKGTVYARPFVWFGNWNRRPQKGAKLLVDGFSLVETEQQPTAAKK